MYYYWLIYRGSQINLLVLRMYIFRTKLEMRYNVLLLVDLSWISDKSVSSQNVYIQERFYVLGCQESNLVFSQQKNMSNSTVHDHVKRLFKLLSKNLLLYYRNLEIKVIYIFIASNCYFGTQRVLLLMSIWKYACIISKY